MVERSGRGTGIEEKDVFDLMASRRMGMTIDNGIHAPTLKLWTASFIEFFPDSGFYSKGGASSMDQANLEPFSFDNPFLRKGPANIDGIHIAADRNQLLLA
jgi:hypothetical protein